ncbi:hypothetical protein [Neoroseomonas lacus]|uniref:Uncharacterized protein n=1 Tax=Neoroseomonas lacus TaxID=287609 RepID=A0A917NU33_9PROT|nr:hypothetical protein [Neoroseomonas lacus]GGJ28296.1 hypothetical protein GCM10011320_39540 [Neoroseomonas lacus]
MRKDRLNGTILQIWQKAVLPEDALHEQASLRNLTLWAFAEQTEYAQEVVEPWTTVAGRNRP